MKVLIVDMTHGGKILASEFSKKPNYQVYAWDIYHTLSDGEKEELTANQVQLVNDDFINNVDETSQVKIIAPIHCSLPVKPHLTHHQAVKLLMEPEINVPIIEVTGVKGKTSTVHVLKELFREDKPLILSSNGVEIVQDHVEKLLIENISITPSSIITAWRVGAKQFKPGICIFETSLGGTGLADVGIITNVVENYPIAGGFNRAAPAKEQIFSSQMVVVEENSLDTHYNHKRDLDRVKSFSIDPPSNVFVSHVHYGLKETRVTLGFRNFKTKSGKTYQRPFSFKTFAPSPYHLENVLSAITAALVLEKSDKSIIEGIEKFRGIKGRTSIFIKDDCRIIQEINPGINVTAIKKAVRMMQDYDDSALIVGGQYGITCEEIDEDQLTQFLNSFDPNRKLVLVDELGKSLYPKIKRQTHYKNRIDEAIDFLAENGAKNILLIYRSNYANIQKR